MAPRKPSGDELPGYRIDLRKAADLVPYARNSRTHSDEQIVELMGMIREFGWTNPILADEVIRAGHGRQMAALRLYEAGESIRLPNGTELPKGMVPVIDCSGWTEAQKKAYVIWDNRSSERSAWDDELLKVELGDLRELDFEITNLGFSAKDLESLFAAEADEGEKKADTSEQMGSLVYQVIVSCRDEDHQRELLDRFEAEALPARALIS